MHITGTNGKGSTAQIATRLLEAHGLTVGTYTSPHLQRINERIAVNGEPIADDDLADAIRAIADAEALAGVEPSYFEILTAAAYRWFADVAVDVVVAEVGLLGRWDATNVADGQVAIVTNVALDHTEYAGPTRLDIAREKAGIVKPGASLVLGETDPELVPVFLAEQPGEAFLRDVDFACNDNMLAVGGRLLEIRTPGASYPELFLPLHGAASRRQRRGRVDRGRDVLRRTVVTRAHHHRLRERRDARSIRDREPPSLRGARRSPQRGRRRRGRSGGRRGVLRGR